MKYLDELDTISKLRMFYKGDVYDKMKGTDRISSLTTEQKQNFVYEKIFNDDSIVNSVSTISAFLSGEEVADNLPTNILPADIISSISESTASKPPLFEISIYGSDIETSETTNSTFGDISWKSDNSTQVNYLDSLFTGSLKATSESIMLIKVKNSELHPAYHSTEASEVFLNYIPVIERSRCTPMFSVDVFTRTTLPQDSALMTDEVSKIIDSTALRGELDNQLPNLSALKFLNGNSVIKKDRNNTADGLLTLASTTLHTGTSIQEKMKDADGKEVPARFELDPDSTNEFGIIKPNTTKNPYVIQKNGMEMFTMPQSLISKTKHDIDIDPFRPFMSIKSATITTQSAGQGIISWNTAELVIDVYDRHRLNDIAYFLDPGKYAFTKFELTAGWKHQDSTSPYGRYIERMVSKELYSLKSSAYTFNDAGVVTVNLSLAMNGAREMSNYSMFAAVSEGQGLRDAHETLKKNLQTIRDGTAVINSQQTTGNLLPTSIITQQNSASAMVLNKEALELVIDSKKNGDMTDEDRAEFSKALTSLEGGELSNYYNELKKYVDEFLIESGLNAGSVDEIIPDSPGDPYEYKYTSAGEWFFREKGDEPWISPDADGLASIKATFPKVPEQLVSTNSGETVRFDKLLINALIKRMLQGAESAADEIHVFIYEFNDKCPTLRNTYMGDFKINVDKVSQKLKKVIETTQNLTVTNFLKVISSEMKDKLNPQFEIVSDAKASEYALANDDIKLIIDTLDEFKAKKKQKEAELEAVTKDKKKEAIQKEIDEAQEIIDGSKDLLAIAEDKIEEIITNSENIIRKNQRTSTLDMPDLKIKVESKKSTDGKNILRVHVYDGKSKPNELSTFLANLNNEVSFEYDADALGTKSKAEEAKTKLDDEGLAYVKTITDRYGKEKKRLVVNTQSHKLKRVIKNIMPSITYGVEGTAINKASMSMTSDANIQANFLLQTQNENTPNTPNTQTGESDQDAQRIMPANISLDMMGCPLLRYAQQFFVDFDTNTDLDNVYGMTTITHTISPGSFKTTAQLVPTFKGSVSFGSFLSDIELISDPPATTETTSE